MNQQYQDLVTALQSIWGCPFAENGWTTRPKSDNWGVITLEFESDSLHGDDLKQARAFEGSVDLFSRKKDGDGCIPLIEEALTAVCESCWRMNSHQWERNEGVFHWEWVFQVED